MIEKKFFIGIFFVLIIVNLFPLISAHCPLCTAGAVGGIGIARYLGVDDSIVGIFIGAFIVSTALWFNKWLLKKGKNFPLQETILMIASFLLLVIPLYTAGIITDFEMVKSMPEHHSVLGMGIYGIDKLFLGIIVGSIFVWMAFTFSDAIKRKRGSILWPYQGISFMFITLVVLSLMFWFITK